jgi:hypothetical protein
VELLIIIVPNLSDKTPAPVSYTPQNFKSIFTSQLDIAVKKHDEFLRLADSMVHDYFWISGFKNVWSF